MKLANLFSKINQPSPERDLYAKIVTKARQPWLYQKAGIPDTVTGRFDALALHCYLVLDRLQDEGERAEKLSQGLVDEVFLELDRSLREMEVRKSSAARKIKNVFFGAITAYGTAFDKPDSERHAALQKAFGDYITGSDVDPDVLERLTDYAIKTRSDLAKVALNDLLKGKDIFLPENEST